MAYPLVVARSPIPSALSRLAAARNPSRGESFPLVVLDDDAVTEAVEVLGMGRGPVVALSALVEGAAAVLASADGAALSASLAPMARRWPEVRDDHEERPPSLRAGAALVWALFRGNAAAGRATELLGGLSDLAGGVCTEAGAAAANDEARRCLALLRAPLERAPGSLLGQLRAALELWGGYLPERLRRRMLQAGDELLEEDTRGGGHGPIVLPSLATEDGWIGAGDGEAGSLRADGFSADSAWMPNLVLIAKNTLVWLDQLSRRFERPITRLDEVPDAAIAELAERGFTGLWLIGLWRRSEASRTIKQRRGNPDAAASAYSISSYDVAPEIGGDEALAVLRQRLAAHGMKLGADMVPNHTGIDSDWVLAHPERFVQLSEPPYPSHRFEGPDLSPDPRVRIHLEAGYWDESDAAVTFRREDVATGEVRYLYHGNDGTQMPWNDTAQLDFCRADVREAVRDTILKVAQRVDIIRFDAAMTLTRQHYRRLWHPAPGDGGAVPTRTRFGMSPEAFDLAMPGELWRDVVDTVAKSAPDTLLLAEAFWLTEAYFVRVLGMHRVYNSAFMHMLAAEENARYRAFLREAAAESPEVLRRWVNFMSNPDEETARQQFGTGDKYFGVATLMATMPGLPMFGHGQVEGFEERYGMEFRRAYRDERGDPELLARHQRQIVPLLRERALFAGVEELRLLDLVGDEGGVCEDVYCFVNGVDRRRVLVLYNNRYERADGRVVGLEGEPEARCWYTGEPFDLRRSFTLDGYQCRVLKLGW